MLNSRQTQFTVTRKIRAPLLPKLRGNFAEFLREVYLARLGAFTPTYLCRFAVRAPRITLRIFLGDFFHDTPSPTRDPEFTNSIRLSFPKPRLFLDKVLGGAGILT